MPPAFPPAAYLIPALLLPGEPIIYVTERQLPDCEGRFGVVLERTSADGVQVRSLLGVGPQVADALAMAGRRLSRLGLD